MIEGFSAIQDFGNTERKRERVYFIMKMVIENLKGNFWMIKKTGTEWNMTKKAPYYSKRVGKITTVMGITRVGNAWFSNYSYFV